MRTAKSFLLATVLLVGFLTASAAAQVADRPDARQLKRDIRIFSSVMDTMMHEAVVEPFGLLEKTKGAYLPGFGLVFSLEINLVQLRMRSPFDLRPVSREELEQAAKQKQQKVGPLRDQLARALADYGSNIELPPTDHLAVIVHLFNYPEEDQEALPSGIAAQVSRRDLIAYKSGKLSYTDFVKRVEFVNF